MQSSSALDKIYDNDAYKRLKVYYPGLKFDAEVEQNEEITDFIRQACVSNVN